MPPRVEPLPRRGGPEEEDVRREHRAEGAADGVGVQVRLDVEGGDGAEGVHARIGPPRAVQADRPAEKPGEGALDLPLYGATAGLDLPAGEVGALETDFDAEDIHA